MKLGRMPGLNELGGVANAHRWPSLSLCLSPPGLIRSGCERVVCVSANPKQTAAVGRPVNGAGGGGGVNAYIFYGKLQ